MTLCYICGWNFKEYYSDGDICPCCGNEYGFNDCLEKKELLEKYCGNDSKKLHIMAPELDNTNDEKYVACDIAWRFLRLDWIKKGCPFRFNEEGIENWTIEDAKKQLKLISYDYDTFLPLANKIISN